MTSSKSDVSIGSKNGSMELSIVQSDRLSFKEIEDDLALETLQQFTIEVGKRD